jgi:hypothetical protein
LDPLDVSTAGTLMGEVLQRSYGPLAAATDDYRVLIAAARARSIDDRLVQAYIR